MSMKKDSQTTKTHKKNKTLSMHVFSLGYIFWQANEKNIYINAAINLPYCDTFYVEIIVSA